MKDFSFLVVAILFSLRSYSQQNFVKGYVLKSQVDTLYGFIDERNYNFNSSYCDFRFAHEAEVKRYLPGEIFGYQITGKRYYVSRLVNNNYVFLEFLVDGQMDVFFMQDADHKNHFFASRNDSDIYELKYFTQTVYSGQKTFLKENKEYIGTLKVLTNDYPAFAKEIEKPYKLKQSNLVQLAEKYHNYVCTDKECIIYHKKQNFRILLEPDFGNNWNFTKNDLYMPKHYLYHGVNILFNNPELNEKIYIGIGYIYKGKFQEKNWIDEVYAKSRPHARIPVIIAYYSNKRGFSNCFSGSYNFELVRRNTEKTIWDSQASISLTPGIKYGFEKVDIVFFGDLTFIGPNNTLGIGLRTSIKL